ncbi:MAG: hypothetical protein HYV60_13055 [Planctomycetia bacterium]|nr:hypothetical protein [Planctomycetia bacterium]
MHQFELLVVWVKQASGHGLVRLNEAVPLLDDRRNCFFRFVEVARFVSFLRESDRDLDFSSDGLLFVGRVVFNRAPGFSGS